MVKKPRPVTLQAGFDVSDIGVIFAFLSIAAILGIIACHWY